MGKSLTEVIMNPLRMRIVQYLMLHEKGSSAEIHEALCDIPTASLYRHIKILLDAGCLEIAEKKQVRGTVKKVYRLSKSPPGAATQQDAAMLVQSTLLSLAATFQQYFADPNNDPQKDMISLSTSTLMLTDAEYGTFIEKLGNLLNEVIFNKAENGRKPRRLTVISSPCEETEKG